MRSHLLVLLFVFVCATWALENTNVQRTIDLTSQLARHTLSITVDNKDAQAASQYIFALQDHQSSHLAYLKVEENGQVLKVEKGKKSGDHTEYAIQLSKALNKGENTKLTVSFVLGHALKPFPTHITQQQRQLVRYFDNHFFYSPYSTATQKTTVALASSVVEDYTENSPTSLSGDKLNYGPYSDTKPFTHSELMVHFESHAPFLTIMNMVKDVEISHWGNLAVEEKLEFRHDGAILKGSFSRFDFQRNPAASPSAILEINEVLPIGASDVYYRDDIGNISTSTFRVTSKGLELHLSPRFPLFGGWQNNFYLGYNLPLDLYLNTHSSDSSSYMLNVSFAADFGNMMFAEQFTVKVVLPEGAQNARVEVPFGVDKQSEAKHYTYLDTTGRTVLVIEKTNVVREHNQYFQVHYTFSRFSMLNEPLLVAGAFFFFFITIMFFVRFELSITKKSSSSHETKLTNYLDSFKKQVLTPFKDEFKDLKGRTNAAVAGDHIRALIQRGNGIVQQASKGSQTVGDKLDELVGLIREQLEAQIELNNIEKEFSKAGGKGKAKYDTEKAEKEKILQNAVEEMALIVDQLFS